MNKTDVDALARLLDGDPTLNGEATEETRVLGRLAHQLSSQRVQLPTPRPEFRAALRAELVESARQQAADPALLTRLREGVRATAARWRYSSRVAAATGATALALSGGGGMAVAAEQAQPSDMLYSTKLVLEDVRVALLRDDASRGQRRLAHAAERIAEAEGAATDRNYRGAAVALQLADESTRKGAGDLIRSYQHDGDPSHVADLAQFADAQRVRLDELSALLDGDALQAALDLFVALERIEARMLAVTGTCDGCGGDPDGGDGFDFATIPPAHEDFVPCRCVLPGTEPAPTPVPPDSGGPPAPAREPDPSPADEGTPPVEQPDTVEPPSPEGPPDRPSPPVPTPEEGERERPRLPEPLRPELPRPSAPDDQTPLTGPRLDGIIKDVLEGSTLGELLR